MVNYRYGNIGSCSVNIKWKVVMFDVYSREELIKNWGDKYVNLFFDLVV